METNNYKWVIIIILFFLIGYGLGTYLTIKAVADIGSRFIDADLIEKAIWQYKNNVGTCYPHTLSLS